MPRTKRDTLPRLAWGIDEVAEALGLGRTHVYEMVRRGEIRAIRAGRRWLIPADALEQFLRERGG